MRIDLSGRKAIVTGSTAGIGLAIAQGLAEAGAAVVVNGRTPERVASALAHLRAACPDATLTGTAADLATAAGAETLTAAHPEADILVNNLGIYQRVAFFDITDAQWQEMFDVNVLSGVRLARHYGQGMRGRGWGRVIFVSSESALHIPAEMVHYGFSKAAQLAVARGMAESLAGTGVTVNSILPGPTHSEAAGAMREQAAAARGLTMAQFEAAFFAEARPSSLIRRFARPEEVAAMAVYVASPQASATTGAALRCDGGIVRTPG